VDEFVQGGRLRLALHPLIRAEHGEPRTWKPRPSQDGGAGAETATSVLDGSVARDRSDPRSKQDSFIGPYWPSRARLAAMIAFHGSRRHTVLTTWRSELCSTSDTFSN